MGARLLPVSERDREAFERQNDATLNGRLRHGLYVGVGVGLVLTPATRLAFPDLPLGFVVLPGIASCVMVLSSLSTRLPGIERWSSRIACLTSWSVATLAAAASIHTGGFLSPFFLVQFLICTFATALLPLSPKVLLAACVPNIVITCAVILGLSPQPGAMMLPVLMSVAVLSFAYFGVVLRHAADLQSFVAHQRLADAKVELAGLNAQLEQRVEAQVTEIVRRAEDMEVLNAQLREKVRERSQELARALRGIDQSSSVLPAGAVLGGRVVIERLLGSGGMGSVYVGTDRVTGRRVAVKVMAAAVLTSPLAIRRFLAEAATAAEVSHPGIVKTVHVDVSGEGRPFLIMEYVEGTPLSRVFQRVGKLAPPMAARIGEPIARALAAAHEAGIVHRDIKPSNVMLTRGSPAVRILDFGVSKNLRAEDDDGLTATGVVVGTPAYMAPEQVLGAASVTAASDVYSLGVMLYLLTAGHHPFPEREGLGVMLASTSEKPRALDELDPSVPHRFARWVEAAMSKAPGARPTASALAEALAELAEGAGEIEALLAQVESSVTTSTAARDAATQRDTDGSQRRAEASATVRVRRPLTPAAGTAQSSGSELGADAAADPDLPERRALDE